MVGHSQGEIAAAVVAGILSLEEGARVVALRSRLLRRVSGSGGMAVTELAAEAVEERLKASEWSGLSLAAVNTPSSTVVSGRRELVERWVTELSEEGLFSRLVNVDYASHSAEVDPILAELESALSGLAPQAGQVPMVSTVTGARCEGTTLDGAYWCRNLRQTVRLDRALEELIGGGHGVFVEASAHPVLAMPLSTASGERGGVVVGSLRREAGGMSELLRNLGVLHCQGVAVEWEKVLGASVSKRFVALPTYAFQRQRYWLEAPRASGDVSTAGLSSVAHPLLGAATPLADSERFLLTGRLSVSEPGWLSDHAVFGTVLVPGTGLLELGFAAARAVGATTVSQLTLVTPLVLPEDGAVRVQVQVDAPEEDEEGRRALSIFSRLEEAPDGTGWTLHAQGVLSRAEVPAAMPEDVGLEAWPPVGGTPIDLTGLYSTLQAHGYGYGPAFQGLREAWRIGDAVYGRVVLPEALSESAEAYGLHPALLDAALHVLGLADAGGTRVSDGSVLLPFEWSEVSLLATGARELRVRASVERGGEGEAWALLQLADGNGRAVARVGGLRLRPASEAQIREAARSEAQHLYRMEWRPVALSEAGAEAIPTTLIVGGDGQLATRLGLDRVESVAALVDRLDQGVAVPGRVVFDHLAEPASSDGAFLAATHAGAERALSELQAILSEARLNETPVAWLTCGAVATGPEEGVAGLSRAPLWGLVRSARTEHPERRLQLLDVDAPISEAALLSRLLSTAAEPELALRHGSVVAPRLVRAELGAGALQAPAGAENYRVVVTHPGRTRRSEPGGGAGVAVAAGAGPSADQRACGRDELPGCADRAWEIEALRASAFEFAGVVEAVGAGVTSVSQLVIECLDVGCGCFGTRAVTPASTWWRTFRRGCRFEAAATVPLAYLTALYALQDLGQAQGGRAGAGSRGGGRRGNGRGAALPSLRGRGVWHGEPEQVVGPGKDGVGCEAHRELPGPELRTEIPVGNGWQGCGCRPQLASG